MCLKTSITQTPDNIAKCFVHFIGLDLYFISHEIHATADIFVPHLLHTTFNNSHFSQETFFTCHSRKCIGGKNNIDLFMSDG